MTPAQRSLAGRFAAAHAGRARLHGPEPGSTTSAPGSATSPRRVEAGQDVAVDLLIGAELVRRRPPAAPAGQDADRSARAARKLRAPALGPDRRACKTGLFAGAGALVARHPDRSAASRYAAELGGRGRSARWRASAPGTRCFRGRPAPRAATAPSRHRGAPALRRRDGLRRALPAADPPDRPHLPQGPQQQRSTAEPGDPGSPWAIGSRRGRPQGDPPRARHARGLPPPGRRARAPAGIEIALDIAFQCSPDHPTSASTPSGSGTGPTARSSTPRTRPRSTRTSIRSTSSAHDWRRALGGAARRRPASGSSQGVRDLPGRQPAHQAVPLLGVADRARSGAATPR